jgi:N-formylglutamate deformylase
MLAERGRGVTLEASVRRHDPATRPIPLVLDSPHSGERYPDDFDHAPPRALVRQAEDTHVARLWSGATARGATLVEAMFPRAYIDANRGLHDIDPALLADPWGEPVAPSDKSALGVGLVWRLARGGVPMYARKLRSEEIRGRIERCWRPYPAALQHALDERHRAFGSVWHIDCHSMLAVGDELASDAGRERADFVLGDRDGTTCEADFTHLVAGALQQAGYSVAINEPYKGVELVRLHGRPAQRRHSLQVEIKRTLYMDEITLQPNAGYARLQRELDRLVDRIGEYLRGRVYTVPAFPTNKALKEES